jgi:hypothetical protein
MACMCKYQIKDNGKSLRRELHRSNV